MSDSDEGRISKARLDQIFSALGLRAVTVREHFLEMAIQSRVEGDPIELANRLIDYVVGDQLEGIVNNEAKGFGNGNMQPPDSGITQ